MTETWRSAWQRHGEEVLSMGFKYFLLPALSVLMADLAV